MEERSERVKECGGEERERERGGVEVERGQGSVEDNLLTVGRSPQ